MSQNGTRIRTNLAVAFRRCASACKGAINVRTIPRERLTLRRTSRVFVIVIAVLAGLLVVAKLRYAGRATVKLPASSCDASLWQHVYEKDRLHVIEVCTAVEGRVVSVHQAEDGDLHIALDPDDKSVLNLLNATHTGRTLVVELICHHPSSGESAAACGDYHSAVTIPQAGDKVRVTGAYVTDRDNGWNEVHPVPSIDILH